MEGNAPLPVTLPLKGLTTINPHVPFDSGFAREFTNLSLYNGRVYLRPGVTELLYSTNVSDRHIHWYDPTGAVNTWVGILANGDIRTLSSGAGATSIGGTPQANATTVKHVSLNLLIGAREPRITTNPFTAWTFTTLSITATAITSACSHKGRLYYSDGSTIEYSDIGQVTGAIAAGNTFSISQFMDGQTVLRMFSITVNPSVTTENMLVVFGNAGKVLVYSGDYPGSPTWQLVGKFDMPIPISNVGFVEISGDIFVATRSYAYWFRDLFTGGAQTAYDNSPSLPIENLWKGLGWDSSVAVPEVSHAFYFESLDAIIVQCSEKSSSDYDSYYFLSDVADYDNEAIYLVYFRKYKAWGVWFTTPMFTPIIPETTFNLPRGVGYVTTIGIFTPQLITDTYTGVAIMVESSWKTPYNRTIGELQKLNKLRVFFESEASGYLYLVRSIFNYSDFIMPFGWYRQSMMSPAIEPAIYADSNISLPANSSLQYQTQVGLVREGGAFSIQFSLRGQPNTVTSQIMSIYAANCYIEQGGESF